jgi:hypothetical protein
MGDSNCSANITEASESEYLFSSVRSHRKYNHDPNTFSKRRAKTVRKLFDFKRREFYFNGMVKLALILPKKENE